MVVRGRLSDVGEQYPILAFRAFIYCLFKLMKVYSEKWTTAYVIIINYDQREKEIERNNKDSSPCQCSYEYINGQCECEFN